MTAAQRAEFRRMVSPVLIEGVHALARVADPGERELESADLLPDALLEDADELLSEALEIVAEAPEGPEVLAALAVAAPTSVALRARLLLEELGEPPVGLGALTVEKAWEMVAGDDPVRGLFLLCERAGAPGRQLFSFTVETLLSDGAVKDGWATGLGEGGAMAKRLTGPLPEEGVEVRSLAPGEAKSRIVAAAERGAQTGLTPTEEGLHALTVWLRASEHPDADAVVQALELGGVTLQELEDEAMARAVGDLAAEAEAWSVEQGLEPEHAASIGFTAGLMGDFLASYLQLAPTDWRGDELEEFMLDWVPRKVTLGDEDAAGFPDHVAEVFGFLAETGRLEPATAVALSAWARGHRDTFAAAMADPALRGPARAVLDAMSADGVELGDEKAMQAWLEDFNMLPVEERDRILGPRVLPSQDLAGGARPGKTNAKRRKAQKQARKRNRR